MAGKNGNKKGMDLLPAGITSFDSGEAPTGSLARSLTLKLPPVLFIESLLEQNCALRAQDSEEKRELYNVLRDYCTTFGLLPPVRRDFPETESVRMKLAADMDRVIRLARRNLTHSTVDMPIDQIPWSDEERMRDELPFAGRCATDFEPCEFIARGGFGAVYRARNRLDGTEYALKMIPIVLGQRDTARQMIREVQLLSRLSHPHVVAYKTAWLEWATPQSLRHLRHLPSFSGDSSSSSTSPSSTSSGAASESASSLRKPAWRHSYKSSSSVVFQASGVRTESVVSVSSSNEQSALFNSPLYLLHIQMQLCPQTLRTWLNERNERLPLLTDAQVELELFRQIVSGVEYIHGQGVVHRDLKPDNIFVVDGTALIGDFGLARLISQSHHQDSALQVIPAGHVTGGVGTRSYASPEQLACGSCGAKSDMYSLGIVLLELLTCFHTTMERHKSIEQLRAPQQHLPPSLVQRWPLLADLTRRLTCADPAERPTASEVLEELASVAALQQPEQSVQQLLLLVQQLRQELHRKDETIRRLRREASAGRAPHRRI